MNWTLEVVIVPVSDVDRAKAFYADQLGFNVDHDTRVSDGVRIVQLTPPGLGLLHRHRQGRRYPDMAPGSLKGLQLVVADIHKARALLSERGVEVSDVTRSARTRPPTATSSTTSGFVFFGDPDGNGWAVQQISSRG